MKHPVDVHVGMKLKDRRILVGLNQKELGNMAGITFQQIQKYEKGINRVSASRLYEIAKILLVPIEYFFEGYEDGVVYDTDYKPENVVEKEIIELVKNFIRINRKEVRKGALMIVKGLNEDKNENA